MQKRQYLWWGVGVIASCYCSLATANEATPAYTPTVISAGKLIQLALVLGAIIALIFICSYFLKRFTVMGNGKSNAIKILNVLPMGTKEKIILVQVGQEQLLIGATQNQLQTLHHFKEPVIQPDLGNDSQSFTHQLKNAIQQRRQA